MVDCVRRVAIVGATGHIGSHFVHELLRTGNHTITALTRAESKGVVEAGVKTILVDYDDEQSLISALKDQQFFIISLSVMAPPDTHSKLVRAAVKAKVPYIMPNAYGGDILNPAMREDPLYGNAVVQKIDEIAKLGGTYIAMVSGFWYEWSLAIGEQWFGFDVRNKKVTFYDDGTHKIITSTWNQCGRALAALLSLPERDASPALADWSNKPFYLSSFKISQRDMLDSLNRVMGTTDDDWKISHEQTGERFQNGMKELQSGDRRGFAKAMYAKGMAPGGVSDFDEIHCSNEALALPKESLDEATLRAVNMVEGGWNPFG